MRGCCWDTHPRRAPGAQMLWGEQRHRRSIALLTTLPSPGAPVLAADSSRVAPVPRGSLPSPTSPSRFGMS